MEILKWKVELWIFTNILIFYTENLTGKVVLWCFFSCETNGKNPQFNFSFQNLHLERNILEWDGKETKILHLLFHRIWKNTFFFRDFFSSFFVYYIFWWFFKVHGWVLSYFYCIFKIKIRLIILKFHSTRFLSEYFRIFFTDWKFGTKNLGKT